MQNDKPSADPTTDISQTDLQLADDGVEDFEIQLTESIEEVLERNARRDEAWLWCINCERFFQARFLRIDFLGNREGCAFCVSAGFNVAIHLWDTFRDDSEGTNWPRSESELFHGLRLNEADRG